MKTSSRTCALWTAIIAVPLLFAAVAGLQRRIDAETHSIAQQSDDVLLRSPAAIQKMSFGYDSLLADIYWTRAVQYYGARFAKKGATFELLWPLLDITTTLDPKLIIAYRFGAIFLSEQGTGGAGRPDLAVELVKRGMAANPDDWHLDLDLGFLYYWRMKDYTTAAQTFLAASKKPGAPSWLALTAANIVQKGGSIETSRFIWSEIYESNRDPKIRDRALRNLQGLKAEQDEMALNEIAAEYQKRFGRFPASTSELRSAGLLNGIPVDPLGYPYVFGRDGRAALNPDSPIVIPQDLNTPAAPKQ